MYWQTLLTQWAGTSAPSNPAQGQPWLDISEGWDNAVLKFYNGSEWVLTNEYNPYIEDLKLARFDKSTLWQFLSVAHNSDGTLKSGQAENMTEWVDSALTPTYESATRFFVDGDQTDIFVQNRRLKATLDASTVYSTVSNSSYDDVNDETTVTLTDSVIDNTLQQVEYGLVKPGTNGSLPLLLASMINYNNSVSGMASTEVQSAIDEIMNYVTPVGALIWHTGNTAPDGFIVPEGVELSRVTYSNLWQFAQNSGMLVTETDWQAGQNSFYSDGDGLTTFRLPDFRGEFLRAWDDGRGVDSGRNFGSWQADELRSHRHTYYHSPGDGLADWKDNPYASPQTSTYYTGYTGGDETRPRNIALLPCIKY